MATKDLTPEIVNKIKELWAEPDYPAAFAGAHTFQQALRHDDINISYPQLTSILQSIPAYVTKMRRLHISEFRPYRVEGVNHLWELDNAIMSNKKGPLFRGFLLVIDCFSRKIFTRRWRNHDKPTNERLLQEIFHENFDLTPQELQGDQEFKHSEAFYKEHDIYFRFVTRRNKAALA